MAYPNAPVPSPRSMTASPVVKFYHNVVDLKRGEFVRLKMLLLKVKWRPVKTLSVVERWAENKRVVGTFLRIEVAVDLQGQTKHIKIHLCRPSAEESFFQFG